MANPERDEVKKARLRLRHAKLRRKAARVAKKLAELEGRDNEE